MLTGVTPIQPQSYKHKVEKQGKSLHVGLKRKEVSIAEERRNAKYNHDHRVLG